MTKSGIASRSPTALYSEARGRLTDTLEERGVPPPVGTNLVPPRGTAGRRSSIPSVTPQRCSPHCRR